MPLLRKLFGVELRSEADCEYPLDFRNGMENQGRVHAVKHRKRSVENDLW